MLKIGVRVAVVLQNEGEYSNPERFEGQTGTIVGHSAKSMNGTWDPVAREYGAAWLVEFDMALAPPSRFWPVSTHFWFPAEDLQEG